MIKTIAGLLLIFNASPTAGNATLVAGTVTVSAPSVTATTMVHLSRTSLNSSTALGHFNCVLVPGVGFTVTSYAAAGTKETGDISKFNWQLTDLKEGMNQ